jgi:very-short-patch-repair endonuclease
MHSTSWTAGPSLRRKVARVSCSFDEAFRAQTQIRVVDRFGRPFARLDMGWEEWKVAVEYDGAHHWLDPKQRSWDIDRWAELAARGWTVIRVSSDLLRYRPDVVVARVIDALRQAGWPGEVGHVARQMGKIAS